MLWLSIEHSAKTFYKQGNPSSIYNIINVYSTRALIGREACFYNCMETWEISRLSDLMSKRKQNNFNSKSN